MNLLSLLFTAMTGEEQWIDETIEFETDDDEAEIKDFCQKQQCNIFYEAIDVNMNVNIMDLLSCLCTKSLTFSGTDLPKALLPSTHFRFHPQYSKHLTSLEITDLDSGQQLDRILDFTPLKNLTKLFCTFNCTWSADLQILYLFIREKWCENLAAHIIKHGGKLQKLYLDVWEINKDMWIAINTVAPHIIHFEFIGNLNDDAIRYDKLSEIRFDVLQSLKVEAAPLPKKETFSDVALWVNQELDVLQKDKKQKVHFQSIVWKNASGPDKYTKDGWITSENLIIESIHPQKKVNRNVRHFCPGIKSVTFDCKIIEQKDLAFTTDSDLSTATWHFNYPISPDGLTTLCSSMELGSKKVYVAVLIIGKANMLSSVPLNNMTIGELRLSVSTIADVDAIKLAYPELMSSIAVIFTGDEGDEQEVLDHIKKVFPGSKIEVLE